MWTRASELIDDIMPMKDESNAHPVPAVWRPVFRKIVQAFVKGDYSISNGITGVLPVPEKTANHIQNYVSDYGEKLRDLPEETWETSIAQWMDPHWEVILDLWTEAEGRSDLVLDAHVSEVSDGFIFKINLVYVP